MKFMIDENIPFAEAFFSHLGQIERFPGRELTSEQLIGVDVLLVRSITKVNAELLSLANKLKFVGTATIGEDHIDKAYLAEKGISFSSAPGCNAISVAEFVISALLVLAEKYRFEISNRTIAIIGVGNIGKALYKLLQELGVKCLLCDPVRLEEGNFEPDTKYVDLETALKNADIVTFHTPLTRNCRHSTFHLLNESNIHLLKEDVCLINACRGEVFDNKALLKEQKERKKSGKANIKLVLDVWEGEPNPLQELIEHTDLATAHIAGYSLEGKAKGTEILYNKVCQLIGIHSEKALSDLLPAPMFASVVVDDGDLSQDKLKKLVHLVYDVRRDDALFRHLLTQNGFDWLRKNYPLRREWSSLQVKVEKKSMETTHYSKIGFAI